MKYLTAIHLKNLNLMTNAIVEIFNIRAKKH